MSYRVYSGPRGSDMFAPIDKDKMLFKQFPGFDEALAWARHVSTEGRVVLLIEGDDGTQLTKQEIAAALQYGESEPARTDEPSERGTQKQAARG
ncbi:MAG TPA: hypothetical protein VHG27_00510 [Xanthobacteraceae bacterium]|nr:hypothetical protein [Xanthobacteraceae bacterium]